MVCHADATWVAGAGVIFIIEQSLLDGAASDVSAWAWPPAPADERQAVVKSKAATMMRLAKIHRVALLKNTFSSAWSA